MDDSFGEVLIPTETVQDSAGGRRVSSKTFYPGYIFVQMYLTDETWHLVRNASKVTGFVGGTKTRPPEVPEAEVLRVTQQMAGVAEKPKPKVKFTIGENVTVVDGPFSNFNGTVEEINEDKAKVKVLVSIFGRPTPVELDFLQVNRFDPSEEQGAAGGTTQQKR